MASPETKIKHQTSVEKYVITLRDDHIESATPGFIGGFVTHTQIFYDEIVVIYRYRKADWTVLTISLLIAVIFGIGGLAIFFGAGSAVFGTLVWLCGLGIMGYYLHRGFVRQNTMVRVVAATTSIEFPCPNESVFLELMSHLKVINQSSAL